MLFLFCVHLAQAERPTEGGLFSFDEADELETVDLENIRVHYSVSGPNQTLLDDIDEDEQPDFPLLVAETAAEVLSLYAAEGFLSPLTEAEMGLSELGGTASFDFYLVDFGGNADGHFGVDACDDFACSGYMVMENDFMGYGYSSIEEATRVLVSHELFHAVQAAYRPEHSSWLSEGTATWAEKLYDPELQDYYGLCGYYLNEATRSIDRPPAGAGSGFVYGTALFFGFIEEQLGSDFWVEYFALLQTEPDEEELQLMEALFNAWDASLLELWPRFSEWNLAAGYRSGELESYPYADLLDPIPAEEQIAEGELLEEDHRFYPLSTVYFFAEHEGGELQFALYEDFDEQELEQPVTFVLYPVLNEGAAIIAPVLEPIEVWESSSLQLKSWELPAGGYWLMGTHPYRAESSTKMEFCLGAGCAAPESEEEPSDSASRPTEVKGGCEVESLPSFLWWLAPLIVWRRVR
jgi:hypothetical protein